MNIVFILEYMGYIAGVDFEHTNQTGLVWLSESKARPEDVEISNNWDYFKENEDVYMLDETRGMMLSKIDSLAGNKRSQYISGGIGQELSYSEKAIESQKFKDGGYINPENYPFINMEAAAMGQTVQETADIILANRDAWIHVGAAIEAMRLGAKNSIRNAGSISAMNTIYNDLQLTFDAI